MDDSPAFRAQFAGPIPAQELLYWRGPVFWTFDGRTWKSSFYGKNIAVNEMPQPTPTSWDYSVQLEPNERKWLFVLDYPATVPPDSRLTLDFQLIRRQPVTQLIQYGVISNYRLTGFVHDTETTRPGLTRSIQSPNQKFD
jgi:hypothetical protein